MVLISWIVSAAVLVLVGIGLGLRIRHSALGILIDQRGRYSLTQLQVVLWSVVVISLIAGVFWGRLLTGVGKESLNFSIPPELLTVMGISVGSAATATVIKAQKDSAIPASVAASGPGDPPRFSQIFLVEEGALADKVIDVTKFQNVWITLILVIAYIALAVGTILASATADLKALPGLSGTLVTLLAVSHAAYIGGKLPNRAGDPVGMSLDNLQANPTNPLPPGTTPRNA